MFRHLGLENSKTQIIHEINKKKPKMAECFLICEILCQGLIDARSGQVYN